MKAETPQPPKKTQRRLQTKACLFMVPPEELDTLKAFCVRVGRPMSWIIRDALKAYMAAVERTLDKPALVVEPLVTVEDAPPKRGRPRKATA